MLKVGSVEERSNGELDIDKEFFGQGYIFKDEDAYRNHKDKP